AAHFSSVSERQFRRNGDKYRANEAAIFRIDIGLLSGKPDIALRLAAVLLKKKLPATQRQNLYYLIGRSHFQKEDFRAALPWLKKSVGLIEKNLISMHDDELRFFYIADKYHIYKMIVQCYLNLGRVQTSYLNNLRALGIVNSRSTRITRLQKKIPADLLKERDLLRIALKKMHRVPGEGHRFISSNDRVSTLEQKLWSIERKIRNFGRSGGAARETSAISPSSLNAFIGKNEVFLDFLVLGDKAGVFYITDRDHRYIELSVSPEELRTDIHKLSFICERSILGTGDSSKATQDINHILGKISKHIVEPIESLIDSKDLIILLEGEFFQIPFLALKNKDGVYLKEGRNIFLISDPMDLAGRNKRPMPFASKENSVFSASLNQLSSIDFEAGEIRSIFNKARIYSGSDAGRTNLLAEMDKTTGFLHIAAHASRSSENPLFSKILLDDGPFFPFDLYGKNIKPALVTLSGCHTAAPGLYYGDSYSLAKVFYQAGTRFVLGSIWPVSDRVSMFFMISFYKYLREHNDVFAAYREAVNATMAVVDNPAFWGAFILLGL
ncbi:MAG: CHAT domain-containing protein, partial [Candidatus Zixiibacteriota bacterium]